MFKVNPLVKRKQNLNKTNNILTSNMVTNQSKPYQQLKNDIEELQKNISSLEKVNANIAENLGSISEQVKEIDYTIDKIFTGNLDVVFFMPEAELNAIFPIIDNAIKYGTNYNVNVVNENDIGMSKDNIIEKFINYYNKGYRYFLTWSYSSILGELNEFFNNISETHPNMNLDEIVLLDTYSTAINLLKSNGEITKRNKHCKRMEANDSLTISILGKRLIQNIDDYDECVMLYVNDTYGAPYNVEFEKFCNENNFKYTAFPHTDLVNGMKYINDTNKKLYVVPILFSDDLAYLFKNIPDPNVRNENNKIKLSFSDSLNFLPEVISNPDFLNKYRKYNATFSQYVGSSPSLSFLKDKLSPNVKGSNISYLIIDSFNIMKKIDYFKTTSSLNVSEIYNNIASNYYGLSGLCKINENNFDRNTEMYLIAMLSINTQLDDTGKNDPFPFIVSESYTEYNGYININNNNNNNNNNSNEKEDIDSLNDKDYYFTNWFNNDIKMEARYIGEGETITSTYGIGVITFDEKEENSDRINLINNANQIADGIATPEIPLTEEPIPEEPIPEEPIPEEPDNILRPISINFIKEFLPYGIISKGSINFVGAS